jgi:phage recombination protein Bet
MTEILDPRGRKIIRNQEARRQEFTAEQIDIIRRQIAPPGTTDDELGLFLTYCARTGLDPFSRQIYLSERRTFDQDTGRWTFKRTPETTIDGFRLIAERTGKYAGQVGPFWCSSDGEWKDAWLEEQPPAAAKVGILRTDFKEPLYAIALFREYCQRRKDGMPNAMWAKMPALMLAKCSESNALRRAFPRELSGLYTHEEMGQAQSEGVTEMRDQIANDKIADIQTRRIAAAEEQEKAGLKKGSISFKGMEELGKMKQLIEQFTRSTDQYYEILRKYGAEHANELDQKKGRDAYKEMALLVNRLKEETGLRDILEGLRGKLGTPNFYRILGEDFGLESMDDALNLDGERLQALLTRLKGEIKMGVTTDDV